MYTDRSIRVYHSKTLWVGSDRVGEERLTIRFPADQGFDVWRESLRGPTFNSTCSKYSEVRFRTSNRDHHYMVMQAILGWLPYAIFADWIEDNLEGISVAGDVNDLQYTLQELRTWQQ